MAPEVKNLCRLCLKPEGELKFIDIFRGNRKIPQQIFFYTGIKVKQNLPAVICDICHCWLNEAEEFKQKCLEANKFFQPDAFVMKTAKITLQEERELEPCDAIEKTVCPNEAPASKNIKGRYRPICSFCGKENESEYRLRQHELQTHTPQLSPDNLYICDLCPARSFKTKQSIRNHLTRSHMVKSEVFPCSVCGKMFQNRRSLYSHEKIHIKSEVVCQYCAKTFSRQILLKTHINIVHLKTKLSQCQYCPHQAITAGSLKKHIKSVHLNIRDHPCDWAGCGKSFHENQHLVRHYRVHTQERPFACRNETCEKAFRDHAKRSRHEKKHCPHRQL